MDNWGRNPLGFLPNHVNYGGRMSNGSSIHQSNRSQLNNNRENGVRRGRSEDVSAARRQDILWLMPNSGSREEYINLERAGPYARMVIMQEMRHIAEQDNRMAPLHQQTSSWENSPGFCTSNSSDPRVNYMGASHSTLHTSTPNGTSGSSFNDGSLFKGYRQEAASRITPINSNMQGIERVVSKMNSSPEQASGITVCSNGDVRSADNSPYSGSILLQSSSQHIIQPTPGHHTKTPTSNHGLFENGQKVHLNQGSAQQNMSISQEKPKSIISEASYPDVFMTADNQTARVKVHLNQGSAQRNMSISQEKPKSIISESSDPKVVMTADNQTARVKVHINQGSAQRNMSISQEKPKSIISESSDPKVVMTADNQTARVEVHINQGSAQRNMSISQEKPKSIISESSDPEVVMTAYNQTARVKVHLNQGSAQQNMSISQEKPESIIFESSDPEVVMTADNQTARVKVHLNEGSAQRNMSISQKNPESIVSESSDSEVVMTADKQIAPVKLPKQNYGVKSVFSETSATSSKLKLWQNFLYRRHCYRIKYGNLQNSSVSFLSMAHEKICVRQCKCELFSRIVSHYDKCADPNCQLCVPVRKLNAEVHMESRKRKNDSGTSTEKSNQILPPPKCRKLENSSLTSDTTRNQPLGSHQLHIEELSNTDDKKNKAKMNLKEHNKYGLSLTEFFTASELKEHLRSFGQWIGQGGTNHSSCQNKCQLCAMDKLEFAPAPMYCSNCRSPIRHDSNYYQVFHESGAKHCFCSSCHRKSSKTILTFPKAKLLKEKNNVKNEESWVQCDKCEGWQHQICALYNDKRDPGGRAIYICPKCWLQELENEESQPLSKTVSLYAKDLPRSMLSDHIEKRLFKRLRKEREDIANNLSKNRGEVPEEADFSVRVVLSVDKLLPVNKKFLEISNESNYPSEFPYRSKVILLFQRIEGVDVCLFGMYVQEFGSNCDKPNQRCVYISYIDSIKYLRPGMKTVTGEALRTVVYHEILIGYLEYCKNRGFSTCYLWACPPFKGEDYLLYCHPESQKIPKADKLQQWYELMLKKAVKENIVVNYTNFYDHFFLSPGGYTTKTVAHLPYFEGAYWSSTAESIIGTIEQDGKEPKLTKAALKAMGRSTSQSDATRKAVVVMEKLGDTISIDKKKYIIVNLQHSCIRCNDAILSGVRWFCNKCKKFNICSRCLNKEQNLDDSKIHISNSGENHILSEMVVNDVPCDTEDNDITVDNNIFASRETFLSFCQKNHYQFDTLRRAKHSSMMILYHLHNSDSVDM